MRWIVSVDDITLNVQNGKRKMIDAAIRGKAEIIKALAKMKIDINCKDKVCAITQSLTSS
jgi:hypothetical protein